jgi:hypothetical protein
MCYFYQITEYLGAAHGVYAPQIDAVPGDNGTLSSLIYPFTTNAPQ